MENENPPECPSWVKGFLIAFAPFLIALIGGNIYLLEQVATTNRKIFHLNFVALLLGLAFQYRLITTKWSTILLTAAGAYVLSFFSFLQLQDARNTLEDAFESWPYFYLAGFLAIATFTNYKSLNLKLNEGSTLLLTLAINYWIFANGLLNMGVIAIMLVCISISFSILSLINAFSYYPLSDSTRLILSTWSCVVTIILAADNIIKIYHFRDIEHLPNLSESLFIFLQFFILGVSGMYIAVNLVMVYLLGDKDLRNYAKELHLKRYSSEQVRISDSIAVTFFAVLIFILNYFFEFLPTNLAIWMVISILPIFLFLLNQITALKTTSPIEQQEA